MFIETSPSQKCCSCVSKNPVFLYLETRAFKHKERVISSLEQAGILSLTGEKKGLWSLTTWRRLDLDATERELKEESLRGETQLARDASTCFCSCFCFQLAFALGLLLLLFAFVFLFVLAAFVVVVVFCWIFFFLSAFVIVLAGFVFVFLFLSLWPLCLVCHFAWKFFGWLLLPWYIYCLLVCWC